MSLKNEPRNPKGGTQQHALIHTHARTRAYTGHARLEDDLAALIATVKLTGRVEEGLARAGIQTLDDLQCLQTDAQLAEMTGLDKLPAYKLFAAAKGAKPTGGWWRVDSVEWTCGLGR